MWRTSCNNHACRDQVIRQWRSDSRRSEDRKSHDRHEDTPTTPTRATSRPVVAGRQPARRGASPALRHPPPERGPWPLRRPLLLRIRLPLHRTLLRPRRPATKRSKRRDVDHGRGEPRQRQPLPTAARDDRRTPDRRARQERAPRPLVAGAAPGRLGPAHHPPDSSRDRIRSPRQGTLSSPSSPRLVHSPLSTVPRRRAGGVDLSSGGTSVQDKRGTRRGGVLHHPAAGLDESGNRKRNRT